MFTKNSKSRTKRISQKKVLTFKLKMKFLNKQFTQETLKLALPVMLTQVGQVSVNLFDNIIVGNFSGAKKHWQQFL